MFRSHFLVMVPVLKGCSSHGLCSASDTFWVFSLTREKFSHYLTIVCLSIHSQFSQSPESEQLVSVFVWLFALLSACFHYFHNAGDRFFSSKLDLLVSQSRGAVCVRAQGEQDKHFREGVMRI